MEQEIERIQTLLGFHYFIHDRIFQKTKQGYIPQKELWVVLRRNHNIPKDECQIVVQGLEILGLVKKENGYYKVEKPKKSREEMVLCFKKKMNLV